MPVRLLYVEDDPIQALVVGELLASRADIETAVEESGAAALARVQGWNPQLLLLDHNLPDDTGPALLPKLRALGLQAPAILLTAHRMAAPPEGFATVLAKPLDFAAFRAAIERFMPAADPGP